MKKLIIFSLMLFTQLGFAQTAEEIMKSMQGKKPPVKTEYNFTASMKYEMTSTKTSNPKGNFKYLLPANGEEALGVEMFDATKNKMISRGVFDMKNKAMIMIMEEQKMAMVIPMDLGKTTAEVQTDPHLKMSPPSKSGKSKVIMGYNCDEWISENQDYKSSMWISSNTGLPTNGLFDMMKNSLQKSGKFSIPAGMSGFPLEIDSFSKKSSETSSITCVEINKNAPLKVSTAGYRVM